MTNRNQVRKEAVDLTVDTNLERQPKQQKLRNAEYYDMQDVMDRLAFPQKLSIAVFVKPTESAGKCSLSSSVVADNTNHFALSGG